jgi:hypothetical protein
MMSLSIKFTHAFNHRRFVHASQIYLTGYANPSSGQGFICVTNQDLVVAVGSTVSG